MDNNNLPKVEIEPTSPLPDTSHREGWKNIASTFALLAAAPIMAIFITIFIFQSYEVYGLSMDTTLKDGDRLIVQKFSKNWAYIKGNDYVPQRGEIIVFDKPNELVGGTSSVTHLIKRVIALPGERVEVKDGTVTVYNTANPTGFNPDKDQDWAKDIFETPGNVNIQVGEDEIFVMGDNRTNSQDSRNFGSINTELITGVAKIRFVPVDKFETF